MALYYIDFSKSFIIYRILYHILQLHYPTETYMKITEYFKYINKFMNFKNNLNKIKIIIFILILIFNFTLNCEANDGNNKDILKIMIQLIAAAIVSGIFSNIHSKLNQPKPELTPEQQKKADEDLKDLIESFMKEDENNE